MKRIRALLLLAGFFAAYKIFDNARKSDEVTHLDGWQKAAENMRPTPKSPVELADAAQPRSPAI